MSHSIQEDHIKKRASTTDTPFNQIITWCNLAVYFHSTSDTMTSSYRITVRLRVIELFSVSVYFS